MKNILQIGLMIVLCAGIVVGVWLLRDHFYSIEGTAEYYFNRGNSKYQAKLYEEAVALYDKAIELDPEFAEAYNARGSAKTHLPGVKWEEAIKDFTKAIELNPKLANAYNNRGRAYRKNGQYDLAIKDLTKAIELEEQDSVYYSNRALAYYARGLHHKDLMQAIADANRAISYDAENAEAYMVRCVAKLSISKYSSRFSIEEAEADRTKFLQLEQDRRSWDRCNDLWLDALERTRNFIDTEFQLPKKGKKAG